MTIDTTIIDVNRLRNSNNGNPRWRLLTEHGEYTTQSDAMCAHMGIERLVGKRVRLDTTPSGLVYGITEL